MLSHFFLQLEEMTDKVEDGFSETKRVVHFKKTNALERGFLNLYMNWKAFKTLFLKKSFNLLFPASILFSYIRN